MKKFYMLVVLLAACSTGGSNEDNKVTITLKNNAFDSSGTLKLYKNHDLKILDINKCKGSPDVGDRQLCSSGTSDFGIYYQTEIAASGNKLPDTLTLNGITPGFYWAHLLFYRNDPDNGCLLSTANGVFQIEENKNVKSTLELGIPHACDVSACPENQTQCDDMCVEINTDSDNCGACGNKCVGGDVCTAGVCGP